MMWYTILKFQTLDQTYISGDYIRQSPIIFDVLSFLCVVGFHLLVLCSGFNTYLFLFFNYNFRFEFEKVIRLNFLWKSYLNTCISSHFVLYFKIYTRQDVNCFSKLEEKVIHTIITPQPLTDMPHTKTDLYIQAQSHG